MIRLGALGDVIRTVPAVHALRAHYPAARIDWLVEPASRGVVERLVDGGRVVDEALILPRDTLEAHLRGRRPLALLREVGAVATRLRRRRYDLVVDLHGILKSGLLSRLTGARVRVGLAPPLGRELSWLFATHRADLGSRRRSRFERNAGLMAYLGVRPVGDGAGPALLQPSASARAAIEPCPGGGRAIVVLHPGSSPGTEYKRYPTAGFARVAQALSAEEGVVCLVVAGSDPLEREQARALVEASRGAAILAPETRSIDELSALCARARLFIGNDSGPLHLASLLGTRVVQVLGPTDPVENEPWAGTPWRRASRPLPCSPCRRGCAAAPCMTQLEPDRIIEAAKALLQEAGDGAAAVAPDLACSG